MSLQMQEHWSPDDWLLYEAGKKNMSSRERAVFYFSPALGALLFVGGAALLLITSRWWPMILMFAAFVIIAYSMSSRFAFVRRARKRQCCLSCGQSLIGVPRGDIGDGICPECGSPFSERNYRERTDA